MSAYLNVPRVSAPSIFIVEDEPVVLRLTKLSWSAKAFRWSARAMASRPLPPSGGTPTRLV